MSGFTARFGRMKAAGIIAGFSVAAIVATALPGVALTNASWTNNQWDNASLGVLNCSAPNSFKTQGSGTFLQANVLPVPPASIADVKGEDVTNPATGGATPTPANFSPAGSTKLDDFTYANPLDVTALGALDADLGNLLQLPLSTTVGVYNQYGQAHDNGTSAGAAGAVNNSGAIALTGVTPPASLPGAASLDLTTLLTSVLGPLGNGVGHLANADVGFGAVSSSATLDACNAAFAKTLVGNLVRSYNIASLNADINSPLVAATVTTATTTVNGLQGTVNGLVGPTGSVLGSVTGALDSVLGLLHSALGVNGNVTIGATVDTTTLLADLTGSIHDTNNIVSINLGTGDVTVDIAKLLGGVNGRNANTQLLVDAAAATTLTNAVTQAVNSLITTVTADVNALLDAIKLTVNITVDTGVLGLGQLCVGATNAPLGDLVSGAVQLTSTPACTTGVSGLLSGVLTTLTSTFGATIGNALLTGLAPVTTGLISGLTTGLVNPLVANVAPILTALLGSGGVLGLVVNEQNAPQGPSGTIPSTFTSVQAGQYDVGAVGVQVPNALGAGNGINVDLARSSVGVNCPVGGNVAPCAAY